MFQLLMQPLRCMTLSEILFLKILSRPKIRFYQNGSTKMGALWEPHGHLTGIIFSLRFRIVSLEISVAIRYGKLIWRKYRWIRNHRGTTSVGKQFRHGSDETFAGLPGLLRAVQKPSEGLLNVIWRPFEGQRKVVWSFGETLNRFNGFLDWRN